MLPGLPKPSVLCMDKSQLQGGGGGIRAHPRYPRSSLSGLAWGSCGWGLWAVHCGLLGLSWLAV
jgi:hypothetical protein